VVIHKRTHFTGDEILGLEEGLAGIETVDILEVTEEPVLRYVSLYKPRDRDMQVAAYPVSRGTSIVLDRRRALLWGPRFERSCASEQDVLPRQESDPGTLAGDQAPWGVTDEHGHEGDPSAIENELEHVRPV
jgi:hypothetical protein